MRGVLDGGFQHERDEAFGFWHEIPSDEDGIPDGLMSRFHNESDITSNFFCAGMYLRMYSIIYIMLYLLSYQAKIFVLLSELSDNSSKSKKLRTRSSLLRRHRV